MGEALRKASKQSGGKEHKESQTLLWWGKASSEEKKNLAQDAGYKGALGLKLAVELSPEQVERLTEIRGKKVVADEAEGKPVTVEPVYTETPVSKAAKKSDKRAKKEGAVAVEEKPPERPSTAKESAIGKLIDAQAKAAAEAQERQQTFIGTQKARERAKGATEREQVAADFKARGVKDEEGILKRVGERQKAKEEAEGKFAEAMQASVFRDKAQRMQERAEKKEAGEKVSRAKGVQKRAHFYYAQREVKEGRVPRSFDEKEDWVSTWQQTKERGEVKEKEGKEAREKKEQQQAWEKVKEAQIKEGFSLTKHIEEYTEGTDYKAIKKEGKFKKALKEGRKKAAQIEEAKQAKKYVEKVTPEEGKWTYAEAQAKAKEMGKVKVPGREIKIGKFAFMRTDEQKRKTYILRDKKPGEYRVVAGTKKELETPTTLKAALAQEKRKFKKRKKLLEKPLREIKRAKKVLRTSSRHIARQILRKPSSLVPTRGKHPAIGNVSMEYRTARIASMPLVPKSVAGTYVVGEDTKRRR
jgi:hypothetical protein